MKYDSVGASMKQKGKHTTVSNRKNYIHKEALIPLVLVKTGKTAQKNK